MPPPPLFFPSSPSINNDRSHKSRQVKQKFKCVLTELKYCGEGLVVQEDYYCCLNNFLFTVNYINLSLENNEVFC